MRRSLPLSLGLALVAESAFGATLPPHRELAILEISDEVNPHGLSDLELTQPGDISLALAAPDSGIQLSRAPVQVDSQCVDEALTALASSDPPDVVIYFAHQAATACGGASQEAQLVALFIQHLVRGGGIVVFHHGTYEWSGKDAMLELLGVSASGIAWDTSVGQRVFNVAPGHFITDNGVTYAGMADLPSVGQVAAGSYAYYDNIPDERYPTFNLVTSPGEKRDLLFATSSGGNRLLSYALEKPDWKGRVVAYQPGEYQPNALDDRQGPNFQVLANAIVYSVHEEGGEPGGSGGSGAGGGATSGGASGGGSEPQGGSTNDPEGGAPSATSGGAHSGGFLATGGASEPDAGGAPTGAGGGQPRAGGSSSGGAEVSQLPSPSQGCSCELLETTRSMRSTVVWVLTTLLLFGTRLRRRPIRI